jgi:nitrite reductase/ring-hydroxylating ferredoxin subunit
MRFFPLEKLINLQDSYSRKFRIDHIELLLIQQGEDRFLIEASCPHRAHPLDVATIAGGSIECALHHYRFSLSDGSLIASTEEPCRGLRTYELIYQGNEVGVLLPE